jgi:hypothetical protein
MDKYDKPEKLIQKKPFPQRTIYIHTKNLKSRGDRVKGVGGKVVALGNKEGGRRVKFG